MARKVHKLLMRAIGVRHFIPMLLCRYIPEVKEA